MLTSKLEVLVEIGSSGDDSIISKTIDVLKSQDGVKDVTFKNGAFMVETSLPTTEILELVSKTSGRRSVLQGFGETQSAVAMISSFCSSASILGVVRFHQSENGLVADGTVDGLSPGPHGIHVHDTGDLSEGCNSIGGHYNPYGSPHGGPGDPVTERHAGDLGNIVADDHGRATFRIVDNILKIWDIIGRSLAVTEKPDDLGKGLLDSSKIDGNCGQSLACGIIARSAGIFQNPKRICACDGVVVWDEKDRPLAGKGRRKESEENDQGQREEKLKPCCQNCKM